MKRCPTCRRTYADDTLRFCLEDGTTLVSFTPPTSNPFPPRQAFNPNAPPGYSQSPPPSLQQWAQPSVRRSGMNPKVMFAAFAGLLIVTVIGTYLLTRSGSSGNISTTTNTNDGSARTANMSTGNMSVSNRNTNTTAAGSAFKIGDTVRIVSRAGTFKRHDTGLIEVEADAGHYGTIISGGSDDVPMVRWDEGQSWTAYSTRDKVTLRSFDATIHKSYLQHAFSK